MKKMTNEKIKPIQKVREGQIKASVFLNIREGKTGKFESKSVVLQKSYTDANGQWINKDLSLFAKDVPKVIKVLKELEL